MVMTDADQLREALRLAVAERDGARSEIRRTYNEMRDIMRERDEARAEVERLRKALERVMLCSHPPTGKACNCYRQGDAALRRSTPLATEQAL